MKKKTSKLLVAALLTIILAGFGNFQNPVIHVSATQLSFASQPYSLSPGVMPAPDYQTDLPADHSMYDYLVYLVNDVDAFWSPIMIGAGHADPFANYSFPAPGEPVNTNCAFEGDLENPAQAFYCGFDDQIVVTQEMARQIWEGTYKTNSDPSSDYSAGDFSVAFIVAHEYAHNLQTELGWLPIYEDEEPLATSRSLELNADCLAGVWANSVYHRGLLETADIEEAMRTLADIGQDPSVLNPTHGTPQERTEAFMLGYNDGSASSCDPYLFNPY
ncbi:neutral zinc metallopeptidase [Planococcus shenhongbingii]|uniref:neutral zinc metallopeptidase n=1 Tax=Planococcus shenhongbingii TaxID=3058398 RepID=UPI002634D919|nr:neutral zinc metallopeptidase [Planococcus sp. N016]WKA57766.1 neutral zinc metallopeptidase [Planococcus sp. N016]